VGRADFWRGLWRLADPRVTLASASSMLLGAAAAAAAGPVSVRWLLATVAGVFCIEVAKHGTGDITDFDSGADLGVAPEDRSPFSGGRRVLVDGLLTRGETAAIAAGAYGAGIAVGLLIVFAREPRVLWLGLAGVGLAWAYTTPPLRLAYRGLGELAVAAAYGPLICCGTYLVQRRCLPESVVWLSIPLGLLIAAFLWINEFPDYRADLKAGKRNLVVRLGRGPASRVFAVLVAAAFILQFLLPAFGLPRSVVWGAAGLPFALAAARRLLSSPEDTRLVVPAQAWTLQCFVVLALAAAAGLLFGGRAAPPGPPAARHFVASPVVRTE
jgi:1,4-dihydroxy-2-naphthoate octaprenyltransferase